MKNCFDRTPHTMKDWLLLAAGVAAVFEIGRAHV